MTEFAWNEDKDEWLRAHRGLGFKQVVAAIEAGGLLDFIRHERPGKHAHQKVFIVQIAGYVYRVPCVETAGGFFLKTLYPSRKDARYHLRKGPSRDEAH